VDEEGSLNAQAGIRGDDTGAVAICMRHILVCNEIILKYLSLKLRNLIVRKTSMNESVA